MILRIGGTILLAVLLLAGYLYYSDWREAKQKDEFARYAGAIAETSVAAELYRNKPDSFFIVRDTILNKYSVSLNDMMQFRKKYRDKEYLWAEFWDEVVLISDSLIAYYDSILGIPFDTLADTTAVQQ